jgi:bifunctional ADP-heptose synthase (sugar kinase/adenylyltransferase)
MVYDYGLLRPDVPASKFAGCIDLRTALTVREEQRAAGGKVVWTNGCFDLFHAGHARLLEAARALGDLLIVGINSE